MCYSLEDGTCGTYAIVQDSPIKQFSKGDFLLFKNLQRQVMQSLGQNKHDSL